MNEGKREKEKRSTNNSEIEKNLSMKEATKIDENTEIKNEQTNENSQDFDFKKLSSASSSAGQNAAAASSSAAHADSAADGDADADADADTSTSTSGGAHAHADADTSTAADTAAGDANNIVVQLISNSINKNIININSK